MSDTFDLSNANTFDVKISGESLESGAALLVTSLRKSLSSPFKIGAAAGGNCIGPILDEASKGILGHGANPSGTSPFELSSHRYSLT